MNPNYKAALVYYLTEAASWEIDRDIKVFHHMKDRFRAATDARRILSANNPIF